LDHQIHAPLSSARASARAAKFPPERATKIAAVVWLVLAAPASQIGDMSPEAVVRWTVRRDVELLLADEKGRA
jgi:hypothetical protein